MPLHGIGLMLLYSLSAAATSLAVKLASVRGCSTFEIIFLRSVLILFISQMVTKFYYKSTTLELIQQNKILVICRGILGFFAVTFFYFSLGSLSIGEASILNFTSPFFVGILGRILLKEPWDKIDAFAAICSLGAVIMMSVPEFIFRIYSQQNRHWAIASGLMSAFMGACVVIILRKINQIPLFTNSLVFAGVCLPLSLITALIMQIEICVFSSNVFYLIVLISLFALVSQLLLVAALRLESAATCSTLGFMQVIFAFVLEYLFRGVLPKVSDLLGGTVIFACTVSVSLNNIAKSNL